MSDEKSTNGKIKLKVTCFGFNGLQRMSLVVPSGNYPIEIPENITKNTVAEPLSDKQIASFKETIKMCYEKGKYSKRNKVFKNEDYDKIKVDKVVNNKNKKEDGLLILPHHLQPEGYIYGLDSEAGVVKGISEITRLAGPTCPFKNCLICKAAFKEGILEHMRQVVQLNDISNKSEIRKKAESVFTDSSDSSRIKSRKIQNKKKVPKLSLSIDSSRNMNTNTISSMTTTRDSSSMTCISSRSAMYGNSDSTLSCEYVNSCRSSSMVNLEKQFMNNASTSEFATYNNHNFQKNNKNSTNPTGTSLPIKKDPYSFSATPPHHHSNHKKDNEKDSSGSSLLIATATSLVPGSEEATLNSPYPDLFDENFSDLDEEYIRELEALTPRNPKTMMGTIDYALREGIFNINFRRVLLRLEKSEERTEIIVEGSRLNKESIMSVIEDRISDFKLKKKNVNRYYSKTWRRIVLGNMSKYRSRCWCLRNRRKPDDITLELLNNAQITFSTSEEETDETSEIEYDSDVTEHSSQVYEDCSDVTSSEFDGLSDLSEEKEELTEELIEDDEYSQGEILCPSQRSVNYDDIDSRSMENHQILSRRSF